MPVPLEDVLAAESAESRARIAEMADALRAERLALQRLREARDRSREEIARELGIQRSAVSEIERRTDLYLATLRKHVAAAGGELKITAEFPGGGEVTIGPFRDAGD